MRLPWFWMLAAASLALACQGPEAGQPLTPPVRSPEAVAAFGPSPSPAASHRPLSTQDLIASPSESWRGLFDQSLVLQDGVSTGNANGAFWLQVGPKSPTDPKLRVLLLYEEITELRRWDKIRPCSKVPSLWAERTKYLSEADGGCFSKCTTLDRLSNLAEILDEQREFIWRLNGINLVTFKIDVPRQIWKNILLVSRDVSVLGQDGDTWPEPFTSDYGWHLSY